METARLLLDTHALIWWSAEPNALSRKVKRLIEDDETTVYVSAASAWEIATKVRLGKLRWTSPDSVESYCIGQGFALLPVMFAHRRARWLVATGARRSVRPDARRSERR